MYQKLDVLAEDLVALSECKFVTSHLQVDADCQAPGIKFLEELLVVVPAERISEPGAGAEFLPARENQAGSLRSFQHMTSESEMLDSS